jgi:hypothetical protein
VQALRKRNVIIAAQSSLREQAIFHAVPLDALMEARVVFDEVGWG